MYAVTCLSVITPSLGGCHSAARAEGVTTMTTHTQAATAAANASIRFIVLFPS